MDGSDSCEWSGAWACIVGCSLFVVRGVCRWPMTYDLCSIFVILRRTARGLGVVAGAGRGFGHARLPVVVHARDQFVGDVEIGVGVQRPPAGDLLQHLVFA